LDDHLPYYELSTDTCKYLLSDVKQATTAETTNLIDKLLVQFLLIVIHILQQLLHSNNCSSTVPGKSNGGQFFGCNELKLKDKNEQKNSNKNQTPWL